MTIRVLTSGKCLRGGDAMLQKWVLGELRYIRAICVERCTIYCAWRTTDGVLHQECNCIHDLPIPLNDTVDISISRKKRIRVRWIAGMDRDKTHR